MRKVKLKRIQVSVLLVLLFSILFLNCLNNISGNGNDTSNTQNNVINQSPQKSSGQIILGKKLDDPYTVEAMQEALDSLVANLNQHNQQQGLFKTVSQVPTIEANYLYIRFLPKGKQQADYIQRRDKDLVLHPQPLEYEILQEGNFYIDPSLPNGVVAFYTSVPIDYHLGDTIAYEILDSLFLIEPLLNELEINAQFLSKTTTNPSTFLNNQAMATALYTLDVSVELLELISLKLTNQLESFIGTSSSSSNHFLSKISSDQTISSMTLDDVIGAWWKPWTWLPAATKRRGRLMYQDDLLDETPIEGLRVTAGYWHSWHSTKTYPDGTFSIPTKWRYPTKFQAHFEADDFVLQDEGWEWDRWQFVPVDHHIVQGPTQREDWNRTFVGKAAQFAVVYAAAHTYYYGDIDGLPRPRKDGVFTPRLDIELFDANEITDHGCKVTSLGCHVSGVWNIGESIEIRLQDNNTRISSNELYAITIHELAHSAHLEHTTVAAYWWDWDDVENIVQESYASGVQWWLTKKQYKNHITRYGIGEYTGVIQDLIDHEIAAANGDTMNIKDKINGFTTSEVNDAFMGSTTFEKVQQLMEEKMIKGTRGRMLNKNDLQSLFSDYTDDFVESDFSILEALRSDLNGVKDSLQKYSIFDSVFIASLLVVDPSTLEQQIENFSNLFITTKNKGKVVNEAAVENWLYFYSWDYNSDRLNNLNSSDRLDALNLSLEEELKKKLPQFPVFDSSFIASLSVAHPDTLKHQILNFIEQKIPSESQIENFVSNYADHYYATPHSAKNTLRLLKLDLNEVTKYLQREHPVLYDSIFVSSLLIQPPDLLMQIILNQVEIKKQDLNELFSYWEKGLLR